MKIIDADKLHYKQVYIQTEKGLRPALVVFAKEIRKMPEIVRCKDCKWHRACEFYALGNDRVPYETISECLKWHDDVPVDFYCAWGERIEDDKPCH